MAQTFKAAVLVEPGKPLEIYEIFKPELQFGQVITQNKYSGICRSQLMESIGARGEDKWLPHLLGHEGFGKVIEVGPGVTKVKVGDEVVISWISGNGVSSGNPNLTSTRGTRVNSGASTTFSEISIVSENRVFLAPKGFDKSLLPLFGCAFLTGGGMVLSAFKDVLLKEDLRVLVLGFGGVGTSAALILQSFPNIDLTVVESSESRRELASQLGFSKVISALEFLTYDEPKFDYCFESAGTAKSIETGFKRINDHGTLVFASHPRDGDFIQLDPYDLIKGKTIKGTWGGGMRPEVMIEEIAERLQRSPSDLTKLVGPRFELDNVNEALAYLAAGKQGKPLIEFGTFI
jgi:S-(hydroxymethyl)glutathione dehydrogenase/alcohol dehydrogenase